MAAVAAGGTATSHQSPILEPASPSCTLGRLLDEPSVQLRYSIAGASSFTGAYEPHNILYDRPQDIKSRWTAAAVPNAPDASAVSGGPPVGGSGSGSGSGAGGSSSTNDQQQLPQQSATAAPQYARDSGNGGFLSSYASAVPSSGAQRSPVPTPRRSATGHPASDSAGERQYLILKLERPSVLRKIHFGKFHRSHACNLKDLVVYGSATTREPHSRAWVQLLRCGLKNDNVAEAFQTQWATAEGVPFPVCYIKIVPLATHLPNYNFSIWHVALEGVSEPSVLGRVAAEFQEHRESMALRLMLKHLRSRAYHSAFRILLESSQLDAPLDCAAQAQKMSSSAPNAKRPFEHPIVTQLFHALMQGQWDTAELCLERAAWGEPVLPPSSPSLGESDEALEAREAEPSASIVAASSLLSSYVERSVPDPVWTPILATNEDGETPCGRGGHQMELDSDRGILWLFGGWDGTRDLSDLWAYYIHDGRWRCVSSDVRRQGGPGPRSCHKMVFDPRTGFLYVLGKYIDHEKPVSQRATASPSSNSASGQASSPHPTSSTSRAMLLPRFPGASVADSPSGADQERGAERQDELFASQRGGSMRLSATRDGPESSPRNTLSSTAAGALAAVPLPAPASSQEASGSTRHAPSSPRHGPPHTSRHPWRYSQPGFESDFYRFSTRSERWDRLSYDTCEEGGPKLLCDHQMVIDSETQLLYVFGGREVSSEIYPLMLSGMWKYDVIQRSWTFLFDDNTEPESRIPSRLGHTMLLDAPRRGTLAGKRVLWILAGQRGQTYLADMWTYHLTTGAVRQISSNYSLGGGPEGGFTQRATINSDAREISLFSGLVRNKNRSNIEPRSAFWVYKIERNEWRLVYVHGGAGSAQRRGDSGSEDGAHGNSMEEIAEGGDMAIEAGEPSAFPVIQHDADSGYNSAAGFGRESTPLGGPGTPFGPGVGTMETEPRPRYAAQMVHDARAKLYYIFGGNPVEGGHHAMRLGDLWSLELVRPSPAEVLRKIKFRLRQQRFLEMTREASAMEALVYLQTRVSETVNHEVPEESHAFRKLMAHLLHGSSSGGVAASDTAPGSGPPPSSVGVLGRAAESSESGLDRPAWLSSRATLSSPAGPIGGGGQPLASASDEKGIHHGSSGSEGDSEMLSVSQVLSSPLHAAGGGSSSGGIMPGMVRGVESTATEGRPSQLYAQRYRLFRALCEFLPPEDTEPDIDLLECIDASKISF